MQKQDYNNHRKFWPPHHFIFYPAMLAIIVFCLMQGNRHEEQSTIWIVLAILSFMIAWVSFMMRQHYSLTNQDRIIRLEMRMRFFQLTNRSFQDLEESLSKSQLMALRFASDDELVSLIQKAIKENLTTDQIKKSIVNWAPDDMRV